MNKTSSDPTALPYLRTGETDRIWRRSERRLYDVEPRRHIELVVMLGISGWMRYFVDNTLITVGSRSLLFLYPDQAHFLVEESDHFDMIIAVLAPEMIDSTGLHPPRRRMARTKMGMDTRVLSVQSHNELLALGDLLISSDNSHARSLGLSWWLHRAWTHWQTAVMGEFAASHPAVARALEAIRANPALSLAVIADDTGLSLSHLGQVFRQETGMTMNSYRTRQRLSSVDNHLQVNPGVSLLCAALNAGFGDYSSFYRACLAHRGQAPAQIYRKAIA